MPDFNQIKREPTIKSSVNLQHKNSMIVNNKKTKNNIRLRNYSTLATNTEE